MQEPEVPVKKKKKKKKRTTEQVMSENSLQIISGAELHRQQKERILVYSRAGMGKSRFVLSVPQSWGKIGYYAADDNAWLLQSISKRKRDRVVVVRPEGPDPTAQFMEFCNLDWDEIDPEVGTLIVDTYSKVAWDSISFSANTLAIDREPHYIVGELGKGGIAIPNRGDYQGIDGLSKQYLHDLFKRYHDKHIIFVCHEESKDFDGEIVGGPQHPGRQMIDFLPGQFSTVIRLIRETMIVPGAEDLSAAVVAITENDGKFVAKIRTDDEEAPNPMARIVLQRNPEHYWEMYEKFRNGELVVEAPKKKKKKVRDEVQE
jgi:hypothetical protein